MKTLRHARPPSRRKPFSAPTGSMKAPRHDLHFRGRWYRGDRGWVGDACPRSWARCYGVGSGSRRRGAAMGRRHARLAVGAEARPLSGGQPRSTDVCRDRRGGVRRRRLHPGVGARERGRQTVTAHKARCRHSPDVIIASSSSGLLPTRITSDCRHPQRIVIGHPFNPVYLLPLCEIVGGDLTSHETIERAKEVYDFLDMYPLVVRTEVPGYLADRLQEAMWREILHLVNDGVATTGELDDAITYGPGLRWAGSAPTSRFTSPAASRACGTRSTSSDLR